MRTEEEIIYTIWDIVRGGEISADDPINERLLRRFLQIHRGKHLHRNYQEGSSIPNEAFQELGEVAFELNNGLFVSTETLPKIIQFGDDKYGMMAWLDDYIISVVSDREFRSAPHNRYQKYHPLMKFIGRKLHLSFGQEQECNDLDTTNSALNRAVRKIKEQVKLESLKVNMRAVLVNPDDEPNYDFTRDAYPMPDELIEDLINSVNAREFNLFLRTRSDEVSDMRDNSANDETREEV